MAWQLRRVSRDGALRVGLKTFRHVALIQCAGRVVKVLPDHDGIGLSMCVLLNGDYLCNATNRENQMRHLRKLCAGWAARMARRPVHHPSPKKFTRSYVNAWRACNGLPPLEGEAL